MVGEDPGEIVSFPKNVPWKGPCCCAAAGTASAAIRIIATIDK
jgi:hypothetical protein